MFRRRFTYDSRKLLSKGQVRLVTLLPGRESAAIKCSLHIVNLSDGPRYEALSYEWGSPSDYDYPAAITIFLDGKTFVVRPNLGRALKYLRNPSEKRVLWVDALCINQEDNVEKGIQIEQMRRVYSQAASVLICLGHAYTHIKMALDFLNRLATDPLIHDETITSVIEASQTNTPGRISRFDNALCHTLNDLTYWKRLWILQEVLLAGNTIVLCFGHDHITWETICLGIVRLRNYLDNVSRRPEVEGIGNEYDLRTAVVHGSAASLHDIRLGLESGQPLDSFSTQRDGATNVVRSVLGLAQLAECYKIEDKIYGLLGITNIDMPVHYDKEMFEIYSEALRCFREAFRIRPSDPCEIYTARLSQIFQRLLKGPLIMKELHVAIPCLRMSGILSGTIVQIEDAPKTFNEASDGSGGYRMEFLDQAEHEAALHEVLRDMLLLYERSTGHDVVKREERIVYELSHTPKRHMVLPCYPHYFEAFAGPESNSGNEKVSRNVFRVGSVPTRQQINRLHNHEPQIFIASSVPEYTPPHASAKEPSGPLLGFATPQARIGDRLVRFLETDICLVVRDLGEGGYGFVGSATIPSAGDPWTDQRVNDDSVYIDHCPVLSSAPSYSQFQSVWKAAGKRVDIVMDAETLQFVTSIGRERIRGERRFCKKRVD